MPKNGFLKDWLKKLKLNEATLSTLLGALVVIVVGVLIFNYFKRLSREGLPPTELPEEAVSEEISPEEEKKEIPIPEGLPAKHKVAVGETLWSIAQKYYKSGYNWVDIASENSLAEPNHIEEGQELTIPKATPKLLAELPETGVGGETITEKTIMADKYTVEKGDCLWNIAVRAYGDGFRWLEIAKANNLDNPDLIHPGNEFVLPR